MEHQKAVSVTYNLKQSQVSCWYVVECNDWRKPGVVQMLHCRALLFVSHYAAVNHFAVSVNAEVESTGKKTDAHYTEYQPEYETHKQDVENRRNGLHQSIDHDLFKIQTNHTRILAYISCAMAQILSFMAIILVNRILYPVSLKLRSPCNL
jgi:hypothetical protein